jgi:integrase
LKAKTVITVLRLQSKGARIMPRLTHQAPKYRHHKASGRAVVTIAGEDVYLGAHGTRESRKEYDRVVAAWIASGRPTVQPEPGAGLSVVTLLAAFWRHARSYYRLPDGTETTEVQNLAGAIRPLRQLYGRSPAADFGPLKLKAVRDEMVRIGWARTHINKQISRIRHVFKWGVENELVPASIYHGLLAVSGLKVGRSTAKESAPVKPIAESAVADTLNHLSDTVAAMVRLQLLTGARPGEICVMRTGDIDTTGKIWRYTPGRHKTQHHGHSRVIDLGPRAIDILRPLLKPDLAAFIFSPVDAEAQRHAALRQSRKTPVQPSQVKRAERAGRRRRRRAPGDRYDVAGYRRAIARACDAAFPLPDHLARRKGESRSQWRARLTAEQQQELRAWRRQHRLHPHQLRHTAATKLRREYGLEAARIILGHRTTSMTELYAEQDRAEAMRIMAEVG